MSKRNNNRKMREKEKKIRKEKMIQRAFIATAIIMIVVASVYLVSRGGVEPAVYKDPPTNEASEILIPVSEVTTDAVHYQRNIDGTTIKFFAIKGSDGQVHTAFDACDVCYGNKKGYSQNEDNMRCNNCGNQYAISGIGSENKGGGCWPGYLGHRIEGSNLIITKQSLERGIYYFE